MMLMAPDIGGVGERLRQRLADVEQRFAAELHSDVEPVNTLVGYVERYRGKMLRPTLLLAAAEAAYGEEGFEQHGESFAVLATVVEMAHMATLVHDDVLDEAEVRRRGKTVNALRGNEAAVMLGDYLISHAYHLCSSLPRPSRAVSLGRVIAAATNTVCEGELLQLAHRNDWRLNRRTYFEIIRRKTASLCGLCCRLPALVMGDAERPGGDGAMAEALTAFGEKLGMAFQIVDDLLDLTGDPVTVGKSLGRDLAKGKLTLPMIELLERVDAGAAGGGLAITGRQVREGLERQADLSLPGEVREREAAELAGLAAVSGAVEAARGRAEGLIADASTRVREALPDTPGRALLLELAGRVLTRKA
ncbi:MAG: polyprenyl synthetase family protein [Planctomycetota bacterium]